jgi:hypothetical protein
VFLNGDKPVVIATTVTGQDEFSTHITKVVSSDGKFHNQVVSLIIIKASGELLTLQQ